MHCLSVSPSSKSPPTHSTSEPTAWSILTKHIKTPLSFMKMRICTESKMIAPIQLLDRRGQFGCHPAPGLANLYVSDCTADPDLLPGRTNREHEAACGQAEDLRKEGDMVGGKWKKQPGEARGRKKYCSESFLAGTQVCCSYWCGHVTGTRETTLKTT